MRGLLDATMTISLLLAINNLVPPVYTIYKPAGWYWPVMVAVHPPGSLHYQGLMVQYDVALGGVMI